MEQYLVDRKYPLLCFALLSRKHDVEVSAGNIKQPEKLIKPIFIAIDPDLARLSDLL